MSAHADAAATKDGADAESPDVTGKPRRTHRARRAAQAIADLTNWRHALVMTLVNAVVLALVVILLPSIRFDADRPVLAVVLLAIGYGLIKAYVKPVIQFLALKYLFATYGLVTILINALLLWVLSLVSFDTLRTESVFALLIGGALAGVFSLVLESLFGLTPPMLDTTDEVTA